MYLLTRDTAKTVKAIGTQYLNAVMFLEPGGWRCPSATAECLRHCLRTAGRLRFDGAAVARRRRTILYRAAPEIFMEMLYEELRDLERYCEKRGLFPAVRLNGLSDLDWTQVYRDFPRIQFYEYTKRPDLIRRYMDGDFPVNVHFTLSWTGNSSNGGNATLCHQFQLYNTLAHGSVAQVVDGGIPFGYVNGDKNDLRFLDPPGSMVYLSPKGSMKKEIKAGRKLAMVRDW